MQALKDATIQPIKSYEINKAPRWCGISLLPN